LTNLSYFFKLHVRCVAGWSSLVARRAHNPKVVGSNPAPATTVLIFLWGKSPFFYVKKMNKEEFINIIEPVTNRNDCILWGIEFLRGKRRNTLRVYIDSNDIADINDCENISKDLSYEPMLDTILGEDYILEVSTPGIDRKFFNIKQLKEYIGQEVDLKSKELIDGKRKFSGILIDCNDTVFSIKDKKKQSLLKFNFTDIDICKLKPNYNELIKEYSHAK
tara:strand:+ start:90 stop:749 length:660 start_codon:yes stop_codon:yes gene_type:complete